MPLRSHYRLTADRLGCISNESLSCANSALRINPKYENARKLKEMCEEKVQAAYQYSVAKYNGLKIVTMDRDFERIKDLEILKWKESVLQFILNNDT